MLSQNWEEGLTCRGCNDPILLGAEMLYGKHVGCAAAAAKVRRQAAAETEDVVAVARQRYTAKGRIILTSRQLRELVRLSGVQPVRKPDLDGMRHDWYSRLAGWTQERLERGLSAPEVAGLWLDHLDVGRQPPVRHADLWRILDVIEEQAVLVTEP